MAKDLVGEGFAIDASMIEADAGPARDVPGADSIYWGCVKGTKLCGQEYLKTLEDANPAAAAAAAEPNRYANADEPYAGGGIHQDAWSGRRRSHLMFRSGAKPCAGTIDSPSTNSSCMTRPTNIAVPPDRRDAVAGVSSAVRTPTRRLTSLSIGEACSTVESCSMKDRCCQSERNVNI
jgi:hypothetical protein